MSSRPGTGLAAAALCLLPLAAAGDATEVPGLVPGLQRMEALCEEENTEGALKVGEALLRTSSFASWRRDLEAEGSRVLAPLLDAIDPALDLFGWNGYAAPERAAVHYALGVVQLAAEADDEAKREFESSRALAGDGGLRLDASYNLGTMVLQQGEAALAEIPELAGIVGAQPPATPPLPQAPPGAPAPAQAEEDPLEKARAIYLEAKELLVQRLLLDWRDEDTRANVELVMRRLRQLDEIERRREEQQQQDQQQPDESNPEEDPQERDPQDEDPPNENPKDPQNQQKPPEEGEKEPSEQEPQESEGDPGQPQQLRERHLTREEVQRLLGVLKEHEEQGEEVRARMHRALRKPTDRDW